MILAKFVIFPQIFVFRGPFLGFSNSGKQTNSKNKFFTREKSSCRLRFISLTTCHMDKWMRFLLWNPLRFGVPKAKWCSPNRPIPLSSCYGQAFWWLVFTNIAVLITKSFEKFCFVCFELREKIDLIRKMFFKRAYKK